MNDNEIKCPHCGEVSNIGGLVGRHTNDCPRCGKNVFKQPAFKQFISEYEQDTLQAIADHGCASACVSGMIYYQETTDLYDRYCVELHEVLDDFKDNFGEWPDYVINNLGCVSLFKNAVVWFVAAIYAQEAINA